VIPPGHQAHVPVEIARHRRSTASSNWAAEPKQLAPGVVTARVVLNGSATRSVIRVVNYSRKSFVADSDLLVGIAAPVTVLSKSEPVVNSVVAQGGGVRSLRANRPTAVDTSHIDCIIERLPNDLSQEETRRATEFIRSRAHLFSRGEYDVGRTNIIEHSIDTGDSRPIKQPLRRHATAHLPYIDATVEDMLKNDIIEPAASPWASNVVLIKKKDGGLRFCVDYRHLNNVTYKDSFPLARIDSCLEALGGNTYFSTMDLRAGYWQTVIREGDRDKTAFITRKGQFRFKVLSFGLCCAPSQFARTLELVMSGLTYDICLVYLDDVIVFGKNFDEHLRRLEAVLSRLENANLKLKASKCALFQRRVVFLGHVVSHDGISCDPEKVAVVKDWPTPRTISDIRSFCGLASYYRSFIKGFADIARPLHELTRIGARFEWSDLRQRAFDTLKSSLTTAPILAAPRDEGLYYLDTDASDVALGAVLQQEQEGEIRVIAYASRGLSDAEANYCTTRKELLAVVFGLKKFRQHLLGRHICVRTDNAPLTYLMKTPEPIGQQARWLDVISEFDIAIVHRPGRVSSNADGLSRRHWARGPLLCCTAVEAHRENSDPGTSVGPPSELVAARGLLVGTTALLATPMVRSQAGRTNDGKSALEAARALAIRQPSFRVPSLPFRDRAARTGGCSTDHRKAGAAPLSASAPEFAPTSGRGDLLRHRPPSLPLEHSSTTEAGSSNNRNDVRRDVCLPFWTSSYPAVQGETSASPSTVRRRGSTPSGLAGPTAETSSLPVEDRSSPSDGLAPTVRLKDRSTGPEAVSDHGLSVIKADSSEESSLNTCGDVRPPASVRSNSFNVPVQDDCRVNSNIGRSDRPPNQQGVYDVRRPYGTKGEDRSVDPLSGLLYTPLQGVRDSAITTESDNHSLFRSTVPGHCGPDAGGPVSTGACRAEVVDQPSGTGVPRQPPGVQRIHCVDADPRQRVADHCVVSHLFSADNIRKEQVNDVCMSELRQLLNMHNSRPEWTAIQNMSEETKVMWGQWESLVVNDGLLCRHFNTPGHVTDRLQIVLPASLRKSYVQFVHESCGHWKVAKTASEVAQRVYFPGWKRYVELVVSTCDICAAFHKGAPPRQTPLQPFHSSRPMELLHMDLVGPLPTGRKANGQHGFTYILTVIDNATKYLVTVCLRNKETETVVDALVHEVFFRHAFCNRLLSDLGQEFQSVLCQTCLQTLGIQQLRSSSMHPQTNSVCERVHGGLHSLLAKAVQREQARWPEHLPAVTLAYNTSVHSTTGFSPYFLFYGRQPICELDLITTSPEREQDSATNVSDYALRLSENLRTAFNLVQQTRKTQVDRMKRSYDTRVKLKTWAVGEMVWYYYARSYKGRFSKWQSRYIGPFRIMEVVNATNCILQKSPRTKAFLVHTDRLKKYTGDHAGDAWRDYKSPVESNTVPQRAQLKVPSLTEVNNNTPADSASAQHSTFDGNKAAGSTPASPTANRGINQPAVSASDTAAARPTGNLTPVASPRAAADTPREGATSHRLPSPIEVEAINPAHVVGRPGARLDRQLSPRRRIRPDSSFSASEIPSLHPRPAPPTEQHPRRPIGQLPTQAPPPAAPAARPRREIRKPARYDD